MEELAGEGWQAMDDADPQRAAQRFTAALGLWRGAPYPELAADVNQAATAHLEELRWEIRERLADALVASGRYIDAVALLLPLIAENPLREGLWARLVSALYGAGRRGEALAAYQRARRLLCDELGVEPGPQLQEAQRQVLAGELSGPHAAGAPFDSRQARPRFLLRDIPDFVGRTCELAALLTLGRSVRDALAVAVIDGMPGIGKTTLALHAAHRLAREYPDGQVICDLRAHAPDSTPADPADALASLLRAFGVSNEAIPPNLEDRAALWRSTLNDRRVLLILDDAASATQVRPLLPGGSACLVLVTSRHRLVGLDGTRTLTLDVLSDQEALELLTAGMADERMRDEAAAAEIIGYCGRLPVAIRIAVDRLRQRSAWTIAGLAERLRAEPSRLAELRTDDRSLSAMFATSYQSLDPASQQMLQLLGVASARDIDTGAVAALAGVAVEEVELIMERLLDQHLVTQPAHDHYRMHELLRLYARQTADAEQAMMQHQAALAGLTAPAQARSVVPAARTA
jgi:tetratricopeptide (TPR) repeat protein